MNEGRGADKEELERLLEEIKKARERTHPDFEYLLRLLEILLYYLLLLALVYVAARIIVFLIMLLIAIILVIIELLTDKLGDDTTLFDEFKHIKKLYKILK